MLKKKIIVIHASFTFLCFLHGLESNGRMKRNDEEKIEKIWPSIAAANEAAPGHGKIDKAAALKDGVYRHPVAATGHWYDLTVRDTSGAEMQLAGHVETGRPSRSDPAIGHGG